MMDQWEKDLSCADRCEQCGTPLGAKHRRILSIVNHRPICLECKRKEEKLPDYENMSKEMINRCIEKTGRPYGNPEGYCFHHFCPYRCESHSD